MLFEKIKYYTRTLTVVVGPSRIYLDILITCDILFGFRDLEFPTSSPKSSFIMINKINIYFLKKQFIGNFIYPIDGKRRRGSTETMLQPVK